MIGKFRIVKVEYEDNDVDYQVQMNTSHDNYVLIVTRKTIEAARQVCEFLNGRNPKSYEVVE